jgi:hypothetical protein
MISYLQDHDGRPPTSGASGPLPWRCSSRLSSPEASLMYRLCRQWLKCLRRHTWGNQMLLPLPGLLSINESRELPDMLGSIYCTHLEWKNYHFAWQGHYHSHMEGCTVILEAVASQELRIWHSLFGMAGSSIDISVLHRSAVFTRLAEGNATRVNYEINGCHYNKG